jgi:hypothetical protein
VSFIIYSHHQILLADQIKENEVWHTWKRGETCTGFWCASPKEKDHLKNQGIDGRMGSKWTLERLAWGGGVGWFHRVGLRVPVNAVMNLCVLAPWS